MAEEIADLGRNVMISEELLRQQQAEEEEQADTVDPPKVSREIYEIEEVPAPKEDPTTEAILDKIIEWITYEAAGELLIKPVFS